LIREGKIYKKAIKEDERIKLFSEINITLIKNSKVDLLLFLI